MYTFITIGCIIVFFVVTSQLAKTYRAKVGANFIMTGTTGGLFVVPLFLIAGASMSGLLSTGAVCEVQESAALAAKSHPGAGFAYSLYLWLLEPIFVCAAPKLMIFQGTDVGSGLFVSGVAVAIWCYFLNVKKAGILWGLIQSLLQTLIVMLLNVFVLLIFMRFSGDKKKA